MSWDDYVFGPMKAVAVTVKEVVIDPLTGKGIGAKAKTPTAQCSGWLLDPVTSLEVCVDDLVLDIDTGEMITPAEATRRAREGLIYDSRADEWITPEENRRRNRERLRAQQIEEQTRRREAGEEVYDSGAREWVTPEELAERRRIRAILRAGVRGTAADLKRQPRLSLPAAARMTIGADGIARLFGEPATAEALEEASEEEIIAELNGPDRREAEDEERSRAIKYAVLAMLVAGSAYALGRAYQ